MKHLLFMLLVTGCATTADTEAPPMTFDFADRKLTQLPPIASSSAPKAQLIALIGADHDALAECEEPPPASRTVNIDLTIAFEPRATFEALEVTGPEPIASCARRAIEHADLSVLKARAGERWRMTMPLVLEAYYTESP
jgi:hypothetical protein